MMYIRGIIGGNNSNGIQAKSKERNSECAVTCLDCSGDLIVVGNVKGEIYFYSLDKYKMNPVAKQFKLLSPPSNDASLQVPVTSLRISPCKKLLAVGTVKGTVVIFELGEDDISEIIEDHEEHCDSAVRHLRWSTDSSKLFSASDNGLLVELKCNQSNITKPLSFAAVSLFGIQNNKRVRRLYQSQFTISQIIIAEVQDDIGILDLLCISTCNRCFLFEIPRTTNDVLNKAHELLPPPPPPLGSDHFNATNNICAISFVYEDNNHVSYTNSSNNSTSPRKRTQKTATTTATATGVLVLRNGPHLSHHSWLTGVSSSPSLSIHSSKHISRSMSFSSLERFTYFSGHEMCVCMTSSNEIALVHTPTNAFQLLGGVSDVLALSTSGDVCILLHSSGMASVLMGLPLPVLRMSLPVQLTGQLLLKAVCSLQRRFRRRHGHVYGTYINGDRANHHPENPLLQNLLDNSNAVRLQVTQKLFSFGEQLTDAWRWPQQSHIQSQIQSQCSYESRDHSDSIPTLPSPHSETTTAMAMVHPPSPPPSTDMTNISSVLVKISNSSDTHTEDIIRSSENEQQEKPIEQSHIALSPHSFEGSSELRSRVLGSNSNINNERIGGSSNSSGNGIAAFSNDDGVRERKKSDPKEVEDTTEGEEEDDEEDNMFDFSKDPSTCWMTVGDLSWRERWWDAAASARTSAIRDRVLGCRRVRSLPSMRVPTTQLPLPLPLSSSASRNTSSSVSTTTTMLPVPALYDTVPPNTYDITLQPLPTHDGLGLQLGIVGSSFILVRGFIRSRKGKDTNEDTRGVAERSGLIAVGDILTAVNGRDLSRLGLEQTLSVLQELESLRTDPIQLRFVFGDQPLPEVVKPVTVSEPSSFEEDNPLLDMFRIGSRTKSGRAKRPQADGQQDSPTAGLSHFQMGLAPFEVAAAWLEGEGGFAQSMLSPRSGSNNNNEDLIFRHENLADSIFHALRQKSLYPSIYPTPCVQQRGDPSVGRTLSSLAEDARPFVLARLLPPTRVLSSRRLRDDQFQFDFPRDTKSSSSVLNRRRRATESVLIIRPYAFRKCVDALIDGQRDRIKMRWDICQGKQRRALEAMTTSAGSTKLSSMTPIMTVNWIGSSVIETPGGAVAPDMDVELGQLMAEIDNLRKYDKSGSPQRNNHTSSQSKKHGTSSSTSSPSAKTMRTSTTTTSSTSTATTPPANVTLRLHRAVLSSRINLLTDSILPELLLSWMSTFDPLSPTSRQRLHPPLISQQVASSLGFASPRNMNDLLNATETLLTLYFVIQSCKPALRLVTEGTERLKSSRGPFCQILSRLGLEFCSPSISLRKTDCEFVACGLWTDVECMVFIEKYGAYVDLDVILAVSNIRFMRTGVTFVETLLSSDDGYQTAFSGLERALRGDRRPMDAALLLTRIVEAYGDDFPQCLCLIQAHMWTIYMRDATVGVDIPLRLFPLVQPWVLRRALLERKRDSKKDPDLWEIQRMYLTYLRKLIEKCPETLRDDIIVCDCIETALQVSLPILLRNTSEPPSAVVAEVSLSMMGSNRSVNGSNTDTDTEIGTANEALQFCREMLISGVDYTHIALPDRLLEVCQRYGFNEGILSICRNMLLQEMRRSNRDGDGGVVSTTDNNNSNSSSVRSASAVNAALMNEMLWNIVKDYLQKGNTENSLNDTRFDVVVLSLRVLWVLSLRSTTTSHPSITDKREAIDNATRTLGIEIERLTVVDMTFDTVSADHLAYALLCAIGPSLALLAYQQSPSLLACLDSTFLDGVHSLLSDFPIPVCFSSSV
eukprot:gene3188-6289_t